MEMVLGMTREDGALIREAAAGDDDALRALLMRHGPVVRRRIAGSIARKHAAAIDEDDVMQVTYLEAYLRIGSFTPDHEGAFAGWLGRIAENNLRDAVRGLERAKRPPRDKQVTPSADADSCVCLLANLGGSMTTPSRGAARQEAQAIVDALIDQLPPDYQTVVRRYDIAGQSAEQIAESMGRSRAAVHMLRARALDRLRTLIGGEDRFFTDCK